MGEKRQFWAKVHDVKNIGIVVETIKAVGVLSEKM